MSVGLPAVLSAYGASVSVMDTPFIPYEEIEVGKPVPFSVYNARGRLLIEEGEVVATARQRSLLIAEGATVQRPGEEPPVPEEEDAADAEAYDEDDEEAEDEGPIFRTLRPEAPKQKHFNPFQEMERISAITSKAFKAFKGGQKNFASRIIRLAYRIDTLTQYDPHAMIAGALTTRNLSYAINHVQEMAVLCSALAGKAGMEEQERIDVTCAALTCNVGMLRLQERLEGFSGEISEKVREALREHPRRSHDILRSMRDTTEGWLQAVLYHHERLDGKGYPGGAKGKAIPETVFPIALADSYLALVVPRAHRNALYPPRALEYVEQQAGKAWPEEWTKRLSELVGQFPPGTYLKLSDRRVAMAVKPSGRDPARPIVAIAIEAHGSRVHRDQIRDLSETKEPTITETINPEDLSAPINRAMICGYE